MGRRNRYLKMTKNEIGQDCLISGLATSHFPECDIPSLRMTTSIYNYVRTLSRRFSKPWIDFEEICEPPVCVFYTSTVFVIEVLSLSNLIETPRKPVTACKREYLPPEPQRTRRTPNGTSNPHGDLRVVPELRIAALDVLCALSGYLFFRLKPFLTTFSAQPRAPSPNAMANAKQKAPNAI